MRKITSYMIILICALFILVGCQNSSDEEPKEIEVLVSVNYDTVTIISVTSPHQAVITEDDTTYQITVTLGVELNDNDVVIFSVNQEEISSDDYTLNDGVITYVVNKVIDDPIVAVDVSYDLNGGLWTSDIYQSSEANFQLTAIDKNVLSSSNLTVFDRRSSGLIDFDKVFIDYDALRGVYVVVAWDNHTAAIQNLDIPAHDYIIALHKDSEDTESQLVMNQLMTDDVLGYVILSETSFSSFSSGQSLLINLYDPVEVTSNYINTLDEMTVLPVPVREGFTFLGWFDGHEITEIFMPYHESDDITSLTYVARWFGADVVELYRVIDEIIPDTLSADLDLPLVYKNFSLTWESSDSEVLQSDGTFIKPYVGMDITLTAYIQDESGETYERIYVMHINGKKSLEGTVASSYIYRNFHLLDDTTFDTLDIINAAFITADANGELSGSTFLNNVVSYVLPRATEYGTWVVVSIAPSSNWSEFTATDTLINTFADNVIALINQYGFDGVDIDWEYPNNSTEETRYVKLMQILYQKVKANNPNHLVTTAIAGGMWQPPRYRLSQSGAYVDYINMMTYGMTSNSGYYQNALFPKYTYDDPTFGVGKTLTSTSIEESIQLFNSYGIPNNKIIVGLAFYGISQIKVNGVWTNNGSIHYTEIKNSLFEDDNYIKRYDDDAQVPYIISTSGTYFVSYDDPKSVRAKCAYVIEEGLKGVMFWEWGTDLTGTLLQAIRSSF